MRNEISEWISACCLKPADLGFQIRVKPGDCERAVDQKSGKNLSFLPSFPTKRFPQLCSLVFRFPSPFSQRAAAEPVSVQVRAAL